jgi:hypothetical protein
LVAELPKPQDDANLSTLESVWAGKSQKRCVSLCEKFNATGIPLKVDQRRRQYLKALDENYRIAVPSEFFEKARKHPTTAAYGGTSCNTSRTHRQAADAERFIFYS